MKAQTTLLFFENKLSGYLDNASDIFGLDIAKYTNSKIEDIFSNETALHIKNLPFGTSDEKIGFLSGVVFDARVTKSQISDYTILVMEFNAKKNLNPLKEEEPDTIFESILKKHLPSIEEKINGFSTSGNKKAISSLKSDIQSLVTKIISLVDDAKSKDILNAPESFSYIDLCDFIKDLEEDIHSFENVSYGNFPCWSYYTYIKREHTRNLILGIITHYIGLEQKPYINFSKVGENIVMRIANFPEQTGPLSDDKIILDTDSIKATLNFRKEASNCHIGYKRFFYNDDKNEFLLTFVQQIFSTLKEI